VSLRERVLRLLDRILPTDGDLSDQIVQSGIWITLMNVFDRVLQFVLLIVLARLLSPRDFGLLGIALLTLSALKKFTHLGLDAALIQDKDENVDQYLNTAWVLNFGRNLFIAAIIFLVAPVIADVFSEPRVTPVIRVIALGPLFKALRNPGVVYFRKNLDLHKSFVLTLSGSLTNFVVAVTLAIVYQNVWALVLGFVAADAVRFLMSYVIHSYRPWFEFDVGIARNLLDYGKWMTGTKILNFLYSEGDDAVVGWLLTATSLGFYQIAYRFSNAPATELTHVISRVMFPAYSKLQDDIPRLRDTFLQVLKVVALLAFPMSIGIIIVAPSFIEAFLGSAWLPATLTMQILAVYGLLRAVGATFGPVWKAVGRPDYLTKLASIRVVLIAVLIYPMTITYGIEGTAFLITAISVFPMMPLDMYLVVRTVEISFVRFFRELAYPAAASVFMASVLLFVRESFDLEPAAAEFFVLLALGMASYALAVAFFERRLNWGLQRSFRSMIGAVSG